MVRFEFGFDDRSGRRVLRAATVTGLLGYGGILLLAVCDLLMGGGFILFGLFGPFLMSALCAWLHFLWLRATLESDHQAYLWTAVAAAIWPWSFALYVLTDGIIHLNAWIAFLFPYALTATLAMLTVVRSRGPARTAAIVYLAGLLLLALSYRSWIHGDWAFYRVLIPSGYSGSIQIQFGVKDASPLPTEDGFYLIRIPRSGIVMTSTRELFGPRQEEFFYVSGDARKPLTRGCQPGDGGMVWRGNPSSMGDYDPNTWERTYFIGTEAQLESSTRRE
jgi:hypothetical protein